MSKLFWQRQGIDQNAIYASKEKEEYKSNINTGYLQNKDIVTA